jgi:hypothetical protein
MWFQFDWGGRALGPGHRHPPVLRLGKLTSASPGGNAQPVAQLIEKVSDTRIIVRLFAPASVA